MKIMTKYLIKVIKIKEPTDGQLMSGKRMMDFAENEFPLFKGEMSADSAVEILDHLYKLEKREG